MFKAVQGREVGGWSWPRRYNGSCLPGGGPPGWPASVLSDALEQRALARLELAAPGSLQASHGLAVQALDFDEVERRYLLSSGGMGKINLFDMEDGRSRRRGAEDFKTKPLSILQNVSKQGAQRGGAASLGRSVYAVQWYPFDTGLFVSGGADAAVKAWDTNTSQVAESFEIGCSISNLHISALANHSLIAVASRELQIRLCDMNSGAFSHCLIGHRGAVTSVRWSTKDQYLLASGSEDRTVRLWDIRRSGCLLLLDQRNRVSPRIDRAGVSNRFSVSKDSMVNSHDGAVVNLRFSSDGGTLLSAGIDGRLRSWNTISGLNSLTNFVGTKNTSRIQSLCLSPDGRTVFYPEGIYFHEYCLSSGKRLRTFRGHMSRILCLAFNPRRLELYSGGQDCILLRWRARRRNQLVELATTESVQQPESDWLMEGMEPPQGGGGGGGGRGGEEEEEDLEDDWESSGEDDDDSLLESTGAQGEGRFAAMFRDQLGVAPGSIPQSWRTLVGDGTPSAPTVAPSRDSR